MRSRGHIHVDKKLLYYFLNHWYILLKMDQEFMFITVQINLTCFVISCIKSLGDTGNGEYRRYWNNVDWSIRIRKIILYPKQNGGIWIYTVIIRL
jgi:hypothetical protein